MSFINQTVSNGLFKIVTEIPASKLSIWDVSERWQMFWPKTKMGIQTFFISLNCGAFIKRFFYKSTTQSYTSPPRRVRESKTYHSKQFYFLEKATNSFQ